MDIVEYFSPLSWKQRSLSLSSPALLRAEAVRFVLEKGLSQTVADSNLGLKEKSWWRKKLTAAVGSFLAPWKMISWLKPTVESQIYEKIILDGLESLPPQEQALVRRSLQIGKLAKHVDIILTIVTYGFIINSLVFQREQDQLRAEQTADAAIDGLNDMQQKMDQMTPDILLKQARDLQLGLLLEEHQATFGDSPTAVEVSEYRAAVGLY